MTLSRALKAYKLEGWVKQIAKPYVGSTELLERLRAHQILAKEVTAWPVSLGPLREKLRCPALHGGTRNRGKTYTDAVRKPVKLNGLAYQL